MDRTEAAAREIAKGDPGTGAAGAGDRGAGECPGAPGVTLYCKFLQIQL